MARVAMGWRGAAAEIAGELRHQHAGGTAQHGHLDILWLAGGATGDERSQHDLADELAAIEIDHPVVARSLAALCIPVQSGEARKRLDMRVGAGQSGHLPPTAEAARRAEYDAGVSDGHDIKAETHAINGARAEVLDHHIG